MIRLITFSTYGTHLPGDPRGSYDHIRKVERRYIPPNRALESSARDRQVQPLFELDASQREAVREAIVEKCRYRGWSLIALHIRATHVHGIADTPCEPQQILHAWKSYATRHLRELGLIAADRKIWTHGGNVLGVDPSSLRRAIRYVLEEQGTPMATYVGDFR